MKILHLSTEFAPIAKAGGLGDVLVGLTRELLRIGQEVEVIIPKYDFIPKHLLKNLKPELSSFPCLEAGVEHLNTIWSAEVENCRILLLETHHPKNYFGRGQIYGCQDDTARFLYFSKACLEYIKESNREIDILQIHDWHTASAAIFAKDLFNLPVKSIILTIHNAQYQGLCATWDLDAIGLKGNCYLTKEKLQDDLHPDTINLLKGGVIYADAVNTVSPSYAKEILTPAIGGSLSATFSKYKNKISGILNGIDQTLWNPGIDVSLNRNYAAKDTIDTILQGKEAARKQLSVQFGLNPNQRPWIGSITRIVPQKGPEFFEEGILQVLELRGSFILLGSSPIPSLQDHFDRLKIKHKENPNVLLHFEYNETIAHQLYAALDFLLMPSHFEPCGLSQLIAMRYGTIPIVHKTGGLQDTVIDYENMDIPIGKRNGLVFQNPTKSELSHAILRAICLFRSNPSDFQAIVHRVMHQDFSWVKPAHKYIDLYNQVHSKNLEQLNRSLA